MCQSDVRVEGASCSFGMMHCDSRSALLVNWGDHTLELGKDFLFIQLLIWHINENYLACLQNIALHNAAYKAHLKLCIILNIDILYSRVNL